MSSSYVKDPEDCMLSPALALELELVVPEQPGLDFHFIKQDGHNALVAQPGFKSRQQVTHN